MAYTLADILNSMLTAIQDVLGNIAAAIADNAGVVGTLVVLGGLTFAVVRYGSRIFNSFTRMIGTFF